MRAHDTILSHPRCIYVVTIPAVGIILDQATPSLRTAGLVGRTHAVNIVDET